MFKKKKTIIYVMIICHTKLCLATYPVILLDCPSPRRSHMVNKYLNFGNYAFARLILFFVAPFASPSVIGVVCLNAMRLERSRGAGSSCRDGSVDAFRFSVRFEISLSPKVFRSVAKSFSTSGLRLRPVRRTVCEGARHSVDADVDASDSLQ
jgi:hypothetical protein